MEELLEKLLKDIEEKKEDSSVDVLKMQIQCLIAGLCRLIKIEPEKLAKAYTEIKENKEFTKKFSCTGMEEMLKQNKDTISSNIDKLIKNIRDLNKEEKKNK